MDQNVFLETLKEVAEIVRTAPEPMSEEAMLSYFKELNLNDSQKAMVIEYLTTPHEEPASDDKDEDEGKIVEPGRSKALEAYMNDLKKVKDVKDEQLEDMCLKLLSGDKDMIAALSEAFLSDTAKLATEYATDKIDVEDLIQEGNLAVFIRLTELCGMGEECGLDVVEEVRDSVNDSLKNYSDEVTGEENGKNAIAGRMNLVSEAIKTLTMENGEKPDIYTLSEYTRLSLDELSEITDMMDKVK